LVFDCERAGALDLCLLEVHTDDLAWRNGHG
jgi:hypothetical protein